MRPTLRPTHPLLKFTLLVSVTFFLFPVPQSWAKSSTPTPTSQERRLAHARELLGKYYGTSVVRSGESVDKMKGLVHTWVRRHLPKKWKKDSKRLARTILAEAERYEFDPIFLLSVIMSESSFRPTVRGPVGEIGLMQLRPATAEWIAKKKNYPWKGDKTLEDPIQNVRIGAAFLAYLRDYFDSHAQLYIAAYNMGQGNVKQALSKKKWPKEYPTRVMTHYIGYYSELKEQSTQPPSKKEKQKLDGPMEIRMKITAPENKVSTNELQPS